MLRLATTLLGRGARARHGKIVLTLRSPPRKRTTAVTAVSTGTPVAARKPSRGRRVTPTRAHSRRTAIATTPRPTAAARARATRAESRRRTSSRRSSPRGPRAVRRAALGTCAPLTDLTKLATLVGLDSFTARLGPLPSARRINALCIDGSRHTGRNGTLAEDTLLADIVAALLELERRMAGQLSAPVCEALRGAGLAIVVTSPIPEQVDADVEAMVLQNALHMAGVGKAYRTVRVMVLSRAQTNRAVRASALTFVPGVTLEEPTKAEKAAVVVPPREVVKEQTKAEKAAVVVPPREVGKEQTKAEKRTAATDVSKTTAVVAAAETLQKATVSMSAGRATGKSGVATTAVSGGKRTGSATQPATVAATRATAVVPATSTTPHPTSDTPPRTSYGEAASSVSAGSGQDYARYVAAHYPQDLSTSDYLACLSDITGLYQLVDRQVLALPPALAGLHEKRESLVNWIDLTWEVQRPLPRPPTLTSGGGGVEDDAQSRDPLRRVSRRRLTSDVDTTLQRILTAVGDFNDKLAGGVVYSASFTLEVLRHPLVIVVPTTLSVEDAAMQRAALTLAMTRSRRLDHVPPPLLWVMDRSTTQRYLATGFRPRISEQWKRLRAVSGELAKQRLASSTTMTAAAAAGGLSATPTFTATAAPPQAPMVTTRTTAMTVTTPSMDRERILWTSPRGQPVDPTVLLPLLGRRHYVRLAQKLSAAQRAAAALRATARGSKNARLLGRAHAGAAAVAAVGGMGTTLSTTLPIFATHVMVYRLGATSTLHTAWGGLVESVVRYYESLTGVEYGLPVTASGVSARARAGAGQRRSRSPTPSARRASSGGRANASATPDAGAAAICGVYALVHVTAPAGSEGTMDQLQRELDVMYESLSPHMREYVLLGVRLVTRQQITEANLALLLQSTALQPPTGADTAAPSPSALQQQQQQQQRKALAGVLAESALDQDGIARTANPLFTAIFRGLLGVTEGSGALAPDIAMLAEASAAGVGGGGGTGSSGAGGAVTPGILVTQSACVAAILAQALERLEAKLHARSQDLAASLQSSQGANEELSRRVQRVELKTMVTDAVEEVSGRHEQATAHLVKSLSAMVSQWSTDKLLDGIDARLKAPLEKIDETLAGLELASTVNQGNDPAAVKPALDEVRTKLQAVLESRAGELAAVKAGSTTILKKLASVDALERSVDELRRDVTSKLAGVADSVQHPTHPGTHQLDPAQLEALERRMTEAVRAGVQREHVAAADSTRDLIGTELMDKVEARLERALQAVAAQGGGVGPTVAADSDASTSATAAEEEEERRRRRELWHAMRRRHAVWQRRVVGPRWQQLQQQQQQEEGAAVDASSSAHVIRPAGDGAGSHVTPALTYMAASLTEEALAKLLREQREEMLWLMNVSESGNPRRRHRASHRSL